MNEVLVKIQFSPTKFSTLFVYKQYHSVTYSSDGKILKREKK